MPKVSVCVPVYSVEKYIERCARSLFEQTLDDTEFIFVNDCTPDRSVEILEHVINEYQASLYERKCVAKLYCMSTNNGPGTVRKHAIQLATGDYITFCDSDDWMPKDAIEALYRHAIESDADIVSGDMQWVYDDGTRTLSTLSLPYGNGREAVYRALLTKKYSHTLCCKMFKRELLQEHEYITLQHHTNGEDGMLFYQVLQHTNKVVHLNKVVYYYYQNSQSSTHARLKGHALYGIVQGNKMRLNTCGKIESLRKATWIYVSQVLNDLLSNGYNEDGQLKKIIRKEHMEEFINPLRMFLNYPLKDYIKTMARRFIKPKIIRNTMKVF